MEKKLRALSRGIDNMKEAERVKREEAEKVAAQAPGEFLFLPVPDFPPLSPDWGSLGVSPNPKLLALF